MVGLDLIEFYEQLKRKVDALRAIDISQFCNRQVFEEGEVDRNGLTTMIGETKEIKFNSNNVEIISSFRYMEDARGGGSIVPVSRTEAWISYQGLNEFPLLDREGNLVKSVAKNTKSSFLLHGDAFLVCKAEEKTILNTREKEGDLTQSYDKTPYTNRKFENQRTTHINATKNFDYTTIADRLRTVSWSNR